MKTDNGYRFSLQFPAEDEEYRAVGDYLEALGRRKSDFIVQAVWAFLKQHPDLQKQNSKVVIEVRRQEYCGAKLEQLVRQIVSEQITRIQLAGQAPPLCEDAVDAAVEQMLDDLQGFL